jgi:xanthine/CO dehydrogenase XdhC/CoxF family maturation factor
MLLTRTQRLAGSISGGCLESDLIERAWKETEAGPALVTYDASSSEDLIWGFGLGCNGSIQVLLQRVDSAWGALEFLESCLVGPGVLGVNVETGQTWWWSAQGGTADGDLRAQCQSLLGQAGTLFSSPIFIQALLPPLRLGVFGAGFDVAPLLAMAKNLGWSTVLFDHRPSVATANAFPEADQICVESYESVELPALDAAVIMTHHYAHDREILARVLPRPIPYVGVLGPKARTARLLNEVSGPDAERVKGPVGLNIGAEGPHEISLSIAAEIQAFFSKRQGGALSSKAGTDHAA